MCEYTYTYENGVVLSQTNKKQVEGRVLQGAFFPGYNFSFSIVNTIFEISIVTLKDPSFDLFESDFTNENVSPAIPAVQLATSICEHPSTSSLAAVVTPERDRRLYRTGRYLLSPNE